MKTQTLLILLLFISSSLLSQKSEQKLYDKYLKEIENKDYSKALEILEKYVDKYPESENIAEVYYDKALVNVELKNNENAISDFTMAYEKDSTFADAIRLRGNIKYKANKFDEAIDDYKLAIRINPMYAEAYANIGFAYKKQAKLDIACDYFEKALNYGQTNIVSNIKEICDTNSIAIQKFSLNILTDKTVDVDYGYSEKNPIKIGSPVKRQRLYFELLRDSKGNPVKYKRLGSCCPYPSKKGMFGMAMCDEYEVELNGEIKKLYITFYDYESPKIPVGFYSIKDFEK